MTTNVRVRFAPSPTGYLHVGGARTALFNWLFAKHAGGQFILRIEDTDLERSTAESEEGLLRDLKWLGMDWDEGPGIGGPHGPYRQSERTAIYQKLARELLANGTAYPCFCSEESLEAKRTQAEAEHRSHHYDGTCRKIDPAEAQKRMAAGEPYAIRVKVPDRDYHIDDLIRGRVEWKAETLGDFIVLRSNGMPVYNFCVVVDDALMEISHVIRAEEHLTNTHRQLILYEAMQKPLPQFAHVSLVLGPDKTKLSKRHGATSVGQYTDEGFLAEAMVNFFALLGWSEGVDREIYTRVELIEKFSLERIGKSPAVFDHQKLIWMNGMHIRTLSPEVLADMAAPHLKKGLPGDARLNDPAFVRKLALVLQPALTIFQEAPKLAMPILQGAPPENAEAAATLSEPTTAPLFAALAEEFRTCEWTRDGLNAALKNAGKKAGAKGKALFMPVRVKLTGNCHGPDLLNICDLLGRDELIKRVTAA